MWFAGIDWADDHHDVVVIDADGHPVGTRRVPHTPAGLNDPTRLSAHEPRSRAERGVGLYHRNQPRPVDCCLACRWLPRLSRQPQDGRSQAWRSGR